MNTNEIPFIKYSNYSKVPAHPLAKVFGMHGTTTDTFLDDAT